DGLTFALHNDPGGVNALGAAGGCLGYCGISPSVAIMFDLYSGGSHQSTTNLLLNGVKTGAINMGPSGIVLGSGHPLQITLIYDSGTLTETVQDTITGAVFTQNYVVNIPQIVGGAGLAYVSFTGGTGGETAVQDILSWTGSFCTMTPPPYLTVEGFPSP